ncbi:hypothetical protein F4777DRAFT_240034 [Nemania sp. FL0916]|nr:hypothetical protein F4777DRAFT_240034 [Nemania sp. FL0916]
MGLSASPPAAIDSQPRKRKGRNSDIRKEQNRIASRAYREKRRQKLALLDELLKSDSYNDSMSSVSDETEYNSTVPVPDFHTTESTSMTGHLSNSPTSGYSPAVPSMPSPAGIQPLPSNGPSRDMEAYTSYSARDYSRDTGGRSYAHTEYPQDPNMSTMRIPPNYASTLPPIASTSKAPIYPLGDSSIEDHFSNYDIPNSSMPDFPDTGQDTNMIHALQSLSRLSDAQQQQIAAYIQRKRNMVQPPAVNPAFYQGYSGYHVPVSGMKPFDYR